MRTTIGQLRRYIRRLEENNWSNYSRNSLSPSENDREAITTMQLKTADGENELSGHLQDAMRDETDEELWGPVPPKKNDLTFHAELDPFSQDWHVLPTPAMSSGR